MRISGIASVFPENYYTQQQILDELANYWSSETDRLKALNRFHHRVGVDGRYLALPIQQQALQVNTRPMAPLAAAQGLS